MSFSPEEIAKLCKEYDEEQNQVREMAKQYLEDIQEANDIYTRIAQEDPEYLRVIPKNTRTILMNKTGILSVTNKPDESEPTGYVRIIYGNTTDDIVDDGTMNEDYIYMGRFSNYPF